MTDDEFMDYNNIHTLHMLSYIQDLKASTHLAAMTAGCKSEK